MRPNPVRRATSARSSRRLLVAAGVLLALLPVALPPSAGAQTPAVEHHRTSRLQLDLISRDYDSVTGSWTVVVESRVDSNRVCVPAVFDCIVQPGATPTGATLTDVQCLSPWWGHLGIFTDSCLKQLFFAGHHQRFRYTYVTDPVVAPTQLTISSRFGRGLFPLMVQELASDELVISLSDELEVDQVCPDTTVAAGDTFECAVTVSYPEDHPAGVSITTASLDLGLGGDTGAVLGPVTTSSTDWDCTTVPCTLDVGQQIDPGESASFTVEIGANPSVTGGTILSTATVDYGPPAKQAQTTDPIVVAGSGDTSLSVTKVADQTTAAPGQQVSWTVTVTNTGVPGWVALPAQDVVLADVVPASVAGLSVTHLSGVGPWSCNGSVCTNPSMLPGAATFRVVGTLAADVAAGSLVNEIDVTWSNDVLGPDFPVVAAGTLEVQVPAPTPTTTTTTVPSTTVPTATPARLAFTG